MSLRRDPGYVAARIATFVRDLAHELGGTQVGTVGMIDLRPNLVNVVAAQAVMTVDLRNTDGHRPTRSRASSRLPSWPTRRLTKGLR